MMYMTQGIEMETIFGDGSQQQSRGVMDALLGAGKRILTGESLFMTVFTNQGQGKQKVAFGAPYPGKILPMDLRALGGHLVCQKDSFLCAARGVSVGIAFQKKLGVGLFGGEGFIMQKLEGDGLCFVHAGGNMQHFDLKPGEIAARRHRLPRGVAAERALRHPVRRRHQDGAVRRRRHLLRHAAGARAGCGCSRCRSAAWPIASTPSAPQNKGWRKEEGSILDRVGGLGDLIDGR